MEASPAVEYSAWVKEFYQAVPNPDVANLSVEALEDSVLRHAQRYGARRVFFSTAGVDTPIDTLPEELAWRRGLLGTTQASLEWLQPQHIRNLHRLKQIELHWNRTSATRARHGEYQVVVLAREDLYWAGDVHLRLFPDPFTVYTRPFGNLCERSDVAGPEDKVLVLGGRIAGLVLSCEYYYNPRSELDSFESYEHFLALVAHVKGVRWELVPKEWLPYVVVQHLQQEGSAEPSICLRGLSRRALERPDQGCVHPRRVQLPLCEEFLHGLFDVGVQV